MNPKRRGRRKKRVCQFCTEKVTGIDYKNIARLKNFVSERGKILPRRVTGNCAKHQRAMTMNVKRARHMALMVYTAE
jgi:small subunit ribosomal protein S18